MQSSPTDVHRFSRSSGIGATSFHLMRPPQNGADARPDPGRTALQKWRVMKGLWFFRVKWCEKIHVLRATALPEYSLNAESDLVILILFDILWCLDLLQVSATSWNIQYIHIHYIHIQYDTYIYIYHIYYIRYSSIFNLVKFSKKKSWDALGPASSS